MNMFARMLLILFITISGSGTASGLDRLDRFMRHENRKLEKIEKRRIKYEMRDKRDRRKLLHYEYKRSKSLLKRKEFQDGEYTILGWKEGVGNRAGTIGHLNFETEDGIKFSSNVKGNFEYLSELLKQGDNLVGKLATIKYFNLTPSEVPRFSYVIAIRDYE